MTTVFWQFSEKFCCSDFAIAVGEENITREIIQTGQSDYHFHYMFNFKGGEMDIASFCPFCGEPVEITLIDMKRELPIKDDK